MNAPNEPSCICAPVIQNNNERMIATARGVRKLGPRHYTGRCPRCEIPVTWWRGDGEQRTEELNA